MLAQARQAAAQAAHQRRPLLLYLLVLVLLLVVVGRALLLDLARLEEEKLAHDLALTGQHLTLDEDRAAQHAAQRGDQRLIAAVEERRAAEHTRVDLPQHRDAQRARQLLEHRLLLAVSALEGILHVGAA